MTSLDQDLLVAVYLAGDECAGADAAYELTVEVDDKHQPLRYVGNLNIDVFDPPGPIDDGT